MENRFELIVEINNYEGIEYLRNIAPYDTDISATQSGYNYALGDRFYIEPYDAIGYVTTLTTSSGAGFTMYIDSIRGTASTGPIFVTTTSTSGANYRVGDYLGIGNPGDYTRQAVIRVSSVNGSGGVTGFTYVDDGDGYTAYNTYVTVFKPSVSGVDVLNSDTGYINNQLYDTTNITGSGVGLDVRALTTVNQYKQMLDVDQEETFPLNFVISDIKNIAEKNASYSKTITLPNTDNNKIVLQHIANLNTDTTFDPRLKSKVWVIQDLYTVFEGYLQLTAVNYDDFNTTYEVLLFGEIDTLFRRIGEKTLSDLTSLDSLFTHRWTAANIVNSWNAGVDNGYVYPLMDYGYDLSYSNGLTPSNIQVKQLYPAYYAKHILKAIINEANFEVDSSFLESDLMNHLIIPFSNKSILPTIYDILSVTASNYLLQTRRTGSGDLSSLDIEIGGSYSTIVNAVWNNMQFNNDIYDVNGLYNTATFSYVHNTEQVYSHRFRIDLNILYDNNGGAFVTESQFWNNEDDDIYIFLKRQKDPVTGVTVSVFNNTDISYIDLYGGYVRAPITPYVPFNGIHYIALRPLINNGTLNHTIATGSFVNYGRITGTIYSDWLNGLGNDYTLPLYQNEEVKPFIMRQGWSASTIPDTRINPLTTLWNQIDTTAPVFGCNIAVTDNLPNNIKQKDFLSSFIKMFNLYAEPIKNVTDAFNLETHDTYYTDNRTIKDWSNKLDMSQPIVSQITSDLQAKNLKFSYKEDKDKLNNDYQEDTKHIYGDYLYTYDNDFTTETTEIMPIFSPTPINTMINSNEIHLPIIKSVKTNGDATQIEGFNIRLLYYNKKSLTNEVFRFNGVTYSYYPYCGPFNDPNNPSISLNFGQIAPFQFTEFNDTIHNIFYDYWQNTILELGDKNSRLITAYLYLNAIDISNFKFNDLIFLNINGEDGYWRVNKIENYDPGYEGSTKVELLKAIYYDIPVNRLAYLVDSTAPTNISRPVSRGSNLATSRNAVMYGNNILSIGNDTLAYGNNIVALGSTNVLSGTNIYSAGENNILSGDNIINFGSDNTINAVNTVVMGSGVTSSDSDTFVIGYTTVFNYPVTFLGTVSGIAGIGATGAAGAAGATGSQGPQGPQGFQGFQGIIGNTGSQGPIGTQGFQGLQGPQGFQGIIGNTGSQGPAGSISGTASYLLYGYATSSTAGVGNGAGASVDMATFSLPANSLSSDGDSYRLIMFLKNGSIGVTRTVNLTFNFGGTVDYTWALSVPFSSTLDYKMEIECVRINNDGFGYMVTEWDGSPDYFYGSTTTFTNYFSTNRTLTLKGIDNAGTSANIVKYVGGYLQLIKKP